uniref:Uncharacterized protein n=1 Tax=Hyaloperonospora arabidopsidis (strain Emoy2) TaxID=559515 RepID=M4BUI1_HYAAE
MQHVQLTRASQVPVPPPNSAPLEISRETRQQLRAVRHRAYERYQENAQWTGELLEGPKAQKDAEYCTSHQTEPTEDSCKQLEASKQMVQKLEGKLKHQREAQDAAQRQFDEMMTILKRADDAAAVKECEAKLAQDKLLLVPDKPRKMDIVRL